MIDAAQSHYRTLVWLLVLVLVVGAMLVLALMKIASRPMIIVVPMRESAPAAPANPVQRAPLSRPQRANIFRSDVAAVGSLVESQSRAGVGVRRRGEGLSAAEADSFALAGRSENALAFAGPSGESPKTGMLKSLKGHLKLVPGIF